MKQIIYILTIIILTNSSCERIKNKGQNLADKTEKKVKSKTKAVADKIFPLFDSHEPDTKYNRKRFKEYLEVGLSEDVNTIYSFGDFLGADYMILISFKCDSSTIQKIVTTKNMKLSNSDKDAGLWFSDEFKWWDKEAIEKTKPYKKTEKSGDWFYLWYDGQTNTAYYEQYSL